MKKRPAFLGIDLGTTGIRALVCDERGNLLCSSSRGIEQSLRPSDDLHISEQDPRLWEPALKEALSEVLSSVRDYDLKAICCDSTSGTVVPVDSNFRPVFNALLHNDTRAHAEALFINKNTDLTVKPSFALSKILWLKRYREDIYEKTYKFISAADYIKGLISGCFVPTDFSNAVKTGYDLIKEKWPDEIQDILGISKEKLPDVVKTAEIIGELKGSLCEEYDIKSRTKIVSGATDSTTGFYSSGARVPGDWNTTLGTVLGIKGITESFITDPDGLLYAHRHPEGFWLPGAASSTGGEVLRAFFGKSIREYEVKIAGTPPTGDLIYPLVRRGEKLPFLNNNAAGFIMMNTCDPAHLFKGFLEGLAFVERMIYEKIERLGYSVGENIFSMGGGTKSTGWMTIRANVLRKNIHKAEFTETAFGSCVIAAGGVYYKKLGDAIRNMVRLETSFEPDDRESKTYQEQYERFVEECERRFL